MAYAVLMAKTLLTQAIYDDTLTLDPYFAPLDDPAEVTTVLSRPLTLPALLSKPPPLVPTPS